MRHFYKEIFNLLVIQYTKEYLVTSQPYVSFQNNGGPVKPKHNETGLQNVACPVPKLSYLLAKSPSRVYLYS